MTVSASEYEGKPAPGTPFDKRRRDLDEMPFLAVRNMAYIFYQPQPDPNQPPKPLMQYNETLKDRSHVKREVLRFELQENLIVPDGTEVEYFNATPQPQGAPAMTTGYPTPPGPPQPGQPAAPPHQPPPGPPPPPSPQAAAAAGYQPPPGPPPPGPPAGPPADNSAEPPPAPSGRKRPGPKGAGVAPPPAAPPPSPQPSYQPIPPPPQGHVQPGPPGPSSWAPPPPAPAAPQAMVSHPVGPAGPPMQPQQQAMTSVDLGPLMATIDRMGAGLSTTSKDVEALRGQVAELKGMLTSNFIVFQYLLGQFPPLAEWLKQSGFDVYTGNVNDFLKFLFSRIPR